MVVVDYLADSRGGILLGSQTLDDGDFKGVMVVAVVVDYGGTRV